MITSRASPAVVSLQVIIASPRAPTTSSHAILQRLGFPALSTTCTMRTILCRIAHSTCRSLGIANSRQYNIIIAYTILNHTLYSNCNGHCPITVTRIQHKRTIINILIYTCAKPTWLIRLALLITLTA
jgi:hypothetical protein